MPTTIEPHTAETLAAAGVGNRELAASLRSDLCPVCESAKISKQTVCRRCWSAAPQGLRQHLYRPMGRGYAAAVAGIMNHYDATAFHLPGAMTVTLRESNALIV